MALPRKNYITPAKVPAFIMKVIETTPLAELETLDVTNIDIGYTEDEEYSYDEKKNINCNN